LKRAPSFRTLLFKNGWTKEIKEYEQEEGRLRTNSKAPRTNLRRIILRAHDTRSWNSKRQY
jgi:hypothetical protein